MVTKYVLFSSSMKVYFFSLSLYYIPIIAKKIIIDRGYETSDLFLKFRLFLNKFKIPGTLFYSRYGLLPDKNLDIVIITGKV